MILLVEQPIMNMLTFLNFVTNKQSKNKRYPHNPKKSVATTFTTYQQYTSPGAPTYPYFSKPLRICIFQLYQSPSGPVYTDTTSFSDLQRLFALNMKIHFKTTERKRLRIPSRTNLRRYTSTIHGFSTLAANIVYHSRFLHPGRK